MHIQTIDTHVHTHNHTCIHTQAFRASGANVTDKHLREVSMCALFLLEAAKKIDKAYSVSPKTTAHAIKDAAADIEKIFLP